MIIEICFIISQEFVTVRCKMKKKIKFKNERNETKIHSVNYITSYQYRQCFRRKLRRLGKAWKSSGKTPVANFSI